MVKDIWGNEIRNGDFVASASKSSGEMVMGVMVDVNKQTRIRVDQNYKTGKWEADKRAHRMYTMGRTLKIPDELIVDQNPELFGVMVKVRQSLSLPTNLGVQSIDTLRKMLESLT